MKTLEQILEKYGLDMAEELYEELKESQRDYAKEALKNASDTNKLSPLIYNIVEDNQCLGSTEIADAVSDFILSESNLPKHR